MDDFYEEDEPTERIQAAWASGRKFRTGMPFRYRRRIWWARLLGRNIWAFNDFTHKPNTGIWFDLETQPPVITNCTFVNSGRQGIKVGNKKWLILP